VVKLPRQPGAREQRWVHLLCGEPRIEVASAPLPADVTREQAALEARVERLEQEVAELRVMLTGLGGLPG